MSYICQYPILTENNSHFFSIRVAVVIQIENDCMSYISSLILANKRINFEFKMREGNFIF